MIFEPILSFLTRARDAFMCIVNTARGDKAANLTVTIPAITPHRRAVTRRFSAFFSDCGENNLENKNIKSAL